MKITDRKYWKLGLFYYNPDDPAVFVEKRFGIGFDFNWAHRKSYYYLIMILCGTILFTGLVTYLVGKL
ncbi:DUF5808 domain-containing protein [Pedobacter frigoris]|uniref:DUF5808 domain-containing protein n=1 Tax=Pedobacter frigoris TaxID=2571272 RepID=UPI001CEC6FD4|nr:DUF5808 domain-containing protein [Pedobacter frigoris]